MSVISVFVINSHSLASGHYPIPAQLARATASQSGCVVTINLSSRGTQQRSDLNLRTEYEVVSTIAARGHEVRCPRPLEERITNF